jgi:hypothetical protein
MRPHLSILDLTAQAIAVLLRNYKEPFIGAGLHVLWFSPLSFGKFLLDIFFIYFSNAIPKVPYTLPTHSHFLALVFSCTGAYKVCKTKGPLFPMMAD